MDETISLNTKIFRKDNLNLVYLVTEKKILNGILHYKLKSERSDDIFLSKFAIKDYYISEFKTDQLKTTYFSRLFSKLIKKLYNSTFK